MKQKAPLDRFILSYSSTRRDKTIAEPAQLIAVTEDIQQRGVLEPILVAPLSNSEKLVVLDGEKRLKAARRLGLAELPYRVAEA